MSSVWGSPNGHRSGLRPEMITSSMEGSEMRERKRGGLVFLLGPVLMLAMTAPVAAQATLDAEALPNWAELPDGRH